MQNQKNNPLQMAQTIVKIFETFLTERKITVPARTQADSTSVLCKADSNMLAEQVAEALTNNEAPAAESASDNSKIEATFAAVVPLSVRLLEEFSTTSVFHRPTSWLVFATGKEAFVGKTCSVRLMSTGKEYEIHVHSQ